MRSSKLCALFGTSKIFFIKVNLYKIYLFKSIYKYLPSNLIRINIKRWNNLKLTFVQFLNVKCNVENYVVNVSGISISIVNIETIKNWIL